MERGKNVSFLEKKSLNKRVFDTQGRQQSSKNVFALVVSFSFSEVFERRQERSILVAVRVTFCYKL